MSTDAFKYIWIVGFKQDLILYNQIRKLAPQARYVNVASEVKPLVDNTGTLVCLYSMF